jgi:hypothetical protein
VAISLAFRVAIALAPHGHRVIKWAEGPGVDHVQRLPRVLLDLLHDPAQSDESLTVAVSDAVGRVASVATFTGSFSTRKLHVEMRLRSTTADVDDQRVMTFHLLKLASGSPVDTWVAGDFTAVETALDTLFGSILTFQTNRIRLSQYRWYKAGPNDTPPQEPVRVVDKNVIGSVTTFSHGLPPQVALSVTEITASRRAWGRVYQPLTAVAGSAGDAVVNADGKFGTTYLTAMANAYDTFYEACRTANVPIVVYSPAKPQRPKKPSGTLPAIGARALTVDTIQIDDIPDVIRSRRWKNTTLKVQRAIG